MKVYLAILVVALSIAAAAPLLAHHSFAAEFDGTKAIRVRGALTKIEWTNPHTYFYVDAKRQRREVGLRGGLAWRAFQTWLQTRRPQTRRRRDRRWLSREGRITIDGCKASDITGWAHRLRSFCRRWRSRR
jgi:uncharacterized protein DUF6152